MKKKKKKFKHKRDPVTGSFVRDPKTAKRRKQRRAKMSRARIKVAKAKERESNTSRFAISAKLSESEILTRLLKMKMREVPKVIPVSVMIVKSRVNKKKQNWATIIGEMVVLRAAGYVVGKSDGIEFLKVLLDRIEGKVPETLRHGLDEYDPVLVELIQGFLNGKKIKT